MARIGTLSLVLCLLVTAASAAVIEIPLPGLLGPYPPSSVTTSRTVTFFLPQVPAAIYGASFRMSGTSVAGSITCEWGGPYDWPMSFEAWMYPDSHHYWAATNPAQAPTSGPFSWTVPFSSLGSGATWDFLLDGTGEISIVGAPAGLVGLCFIDPVPPTGEVTEAVLIIDGDFPIAVEPSTWGRIKALYR